MNPEKRWFVLRYSVAVVAAVGILATGWKYQSMALMGFGCFAVCYIVFGIHGELRRKRNR